MASLHVCPVLQVKWRVYFAYFGAIGVVWLVPIALMNVASSAFSLGSNLWLTAWSNDPPLPDGTQDLGKRDLRLGVYGGLGLGQGGSRAAPFYADGRCGLFPPLETMRGGVRRRRC